MKKGNSILVIEDDDSILEILCETLAKEGYHVSFARNGREGLTVLEYNIPSLIILDLMMPVMSGWIFLEKIRADNRFEGIPVIVTSGSLSEDAMRLSNVLLPKPYDLDTLLEAIKRELEVSHFFEGVSHP